jgi:hypothetical protein
MDRRHRGILGVVVIWLISAGIIWWYAVAEESSRLTLLGRLLYWWMLPLLAFAVVTGLQVLIARRHRPWPWLARHALQLLGAALATVVVCLAVPAVMRVQWDETNLLATSRSMHEMRGAFIVTEALASERGPLPLEMMVDKRPPLFPFAVSVLHDLFGFSIANAFRCNATALFLLLATVGIAVRNRISPLAGLGAIALLCNVPVLMVGARSAGFELFSALLLSWTVLAAHHHVTQPDQRSLAWLTATGLLFSCTRYESTLVMIALLAPTLWLTRSHWRSDRWSRAVLSMMPALLAPVFLQYAHSAQQDFYSESSGGSLAGLQHLLEHLPGFVVASFSLSPDSPFAWVWTSFGGIALLATLILRRGNRHLLLPVVPVAAVTAAGLMWFYGSVAEPTAQRFYLPFATLTAIAPLLLLRLTGTKRIAACLLVAAVATAAWRIHNTADGSACPTPRTAQLAQSIDTVLTAIDKPETALVVTTAAAYLILQGQAAMSPAGIERHRDRIARSRRDGPLELVCVLATPMDPAEEARFGSIEEVVRSMRSRGLRELAFRDGELPVVLFAEAR